MSAVPPPRHRTHELYFDSPLWRVVDVDGVDKVFATRAGPGEVRLDLDGEAEPSSEVGDPGDRVQVSVWLSDEQLRELVDSVLGGDCR